MKKTTKKLKKTTKTENKWIESWQKTMERFKRVFKNQGLKDYEIKKEIKNMAEEQLYYIEQSRPDKTKALDEQLLIINDPNRKEYIDYVRKVAETGEL